MMMAVHRISGPRPPCRWRAARALVMSIMPPTDRSIPRVSTTTVCPTAASDRGTAWSVIDAASKAPGNERIDTRSATATTSGTFWASRCRRRRSSPGEGSGGRAAPPDGPGARPGGPAARPPNACSAMGLLPEGGPDDLLGVDPRACELAGHEPLSHHQDAVAEVRHLLGVGGVEEHSVTVRGQPGDQLVHVLLGGHIHPAGDVVEEQDAALGQQPPPEQDLLLVAAAEGGHRLTRPPGVDVQPLDHLLAGLPLLDRP